MATTLEACAPALDTSLPLSETGPFEIIELFLNGRWWLYPRW
jgi:hypothetical protein